MVSGVHRVAFPCCERRLAPRPGHSHQVIG